MNSLSLLRASLFFTCFALAACTDRGTPVAATTAALEDDAGFVEPELSTSRLVRRIQLSLLGRPPTVAELDAIEGKPTPEAREAALAELIEQNLNSLEFYRQSMRFAHDWFGVGAHNQMADASHGYFTGHLAIELHRCAPSTLHAGALGLMSNYIQVGDPWSMCDDPQAPMHQVQPWWAPNTTVATLGRAGSATPQEARRRNGTILCGIADVGGRTSVPADNATDTATGCGCGPNLVYCLPPQGLTLANSHTFSGNSPDSSRRLASEEVARLFAHLVWYDRPLSDFLVGNYTVAPLALKHMYVRAARFDVANTSTDDSRWWDPATWSTLADPEHQSGTPLAWHEVVVETLHPNLLALTPDKSLATGAAALARTLRYDPRSEPASAMRGIPAAGALTSLVAEASFSRERVRAARWLEALTCRSFIPPPPSVQFNEFRRDPATEGNCQHCHMLIDPAAVFFKRWNFSGNGIVYIGGFGRGSFASSVDMGGQPFARWAKAFDPETVMTPATPAHLAQNPDARFIDFLSPPQKLFGTSGDGTYGPLGFGKILIESGEFDRCVVRKLFERFVGPRLDPATDDAVIEQLSAKFIAHDRKVRPFVRELLLTRPEFRKGL